MVPLATDWATISAFATGVGTLVLALATFASVRSSNRSARIAEAALQEQRRPVLAPSRYDDPVQKIMFVEGRWVRAEGGRAAAEHDDGRVYLAMSIRNVGTGIAVCQAWTAWAGLSSSRDMPSHSPLDRFRRQTRDFYIPAGDVGMWQGALRDPDDPVRASIADAIDARESIMVELLYTDLVGHQQTITRFGITPAGDSWLTTMTRHWHLESAGPRAERDVATAVDVVLRERDAAEHRASDSSDQTASAGGAGGATSDGGQVQDDAAAHVIPQNSAPEATRSSR